MISNIKRERETMGELGEGEGNDAYIIKKKPATQHSAKNVESDYVSHVYILPSFTLFSSRSGLTHYFTHNDMICLSNKQNMLSCTHPGEKKKKLPGVCKTDDNALC